MSGNEKWILRVRTRYEGAIVEKKDALTAQHDREHMDNLATEIQNAQRRLDEYSLKLGSRRKHSLQIEIEATNGEGHTTEITIKKKLL
ncbi:MAG: hypothetical protein AAB573_00735 [Patescibacteria group bacterium]